MKLAAQKKAEFLAEPKILEFLSPLLTHAAQCTRNNLYVQ